MERAQPPAGSNRRVNTSEDPLPSRRVAGAWLIALGACLVASVAVARWHPLPRGFQLRSPPSSDLVIVTPEIDLEPLARVAPPFSAHWRGIWNVRRAGEHVLHVKARGEVRLALDGREVAVRTGDARSLTEREAVFLERGLHVLEVEYTSPAEAPFLRVLWSPGEGGPRGFAAEEVTPQPTREAIWRLQRLRQALRWLLLGAMAALAVLLLAWRARHGGMVRGLTRLGGSGEAARRLARGVAWALPIAVVAYGAALRTEALEGRLWGSAAPGWVQRVAQAAEALRFDGLKWYPAERRYEGDPAQYLEYARAPRSFYEAHRREPLFVYATRLGLWLSGGDDIGISFASLLSSALAVGAAYLVGAQAFSPLVGLLAAFLLAVERQMVALSIEGWRDDTFLLFVLLSTWALLRLDERPSFARGALLGLFGALACLTRITALSFLLPALVLVALRSRRPWTDRARLQGVAAACIVLAALLGPFLWSCWRAYGDPLYAINVHTHFYRREAQLPQRGGMGWTEYLGESFRPFQLLELGLLGITRYPFANKWEYFGYWAPWLPRVMMALALIGLLAFLGSRQGRLLVAVLVTSTLPYAFTWEVPGGAEWRFTAHTYPFYFVAIAFLLERASVSASGPTRPVRRRAASPARRRARPGVR